MLLMLTLHFALLIILACKGDARDDSGFGRTPEIFTLTNHPKPYRDSDIDFKFSPLPGPEDETLLKNAAAFYKIYRQNVLKGGVFADSVHARNITRNPERDLKLRRINSHIAAIQRTGMGLGGPDMRDRVEDVWVLRENHWVRFGGYHNKYYKVRFLDLNDDAQTDAIIMGGCCDSTVFNVLIGHETKILIHQQNISMLGMVRTKFGSGCGKSTIRLSPYGAMKEENPALRRHRLVFDCKTNRFRKRRP